MKTSKLAIIMMTLFLFSLFAVTAANILPPPPPSPLGHQFFGDVSGSVASGDKIVVKIFFMIGLPLEYTTPIEVNTISNPKYGYDPLFIIPADDPSTPEKDGGNDGDILNFYIIHGTDEVQVGTATFYTGGVDKLNVNYVSNLPHTFSGMVGGVNLGDVQKGVKVVAIVNTVRSETPVFNNLIMEPSYQNLVVTGGHNGDTITFYLEFTNPVGSMEVATYTFASGGNTVLDFSTNPKPTINAPSSAYVNSQVTFVVTVNGGAKPYTGVILKCGNDMPPYAPQDPDTGYDNRYTKKCTYTGLTTYTFKVDGYDSSNPVKQFSGEKQISITTVPPPPPPRRGGGGGGGGGCPPSWNCTNSTCFSNRTLRQVCVDTNCGLPNRITVFNCTPACTPSWSCNEWSECSSGIKIRICTDANKCNTNKPAESINCETPKGGTGSVCGNNICEADETTSTCPADCGTQIKEPKKTIFQNKAWLWWLISGAIIVAGLAVLGVFIMEKRGKPPVQQQTQQTPQQGQQQIPAGWTKEQYDEYVKRYYEQFNKK